MPKKTAWYKTTVHFKLVRDTYDVWVSVQMLERDLKLKNLYFASYTGLNEAKVEITLESALSRAAVSRVARRVFKSSRVVQVVVEKRDSGSLAHALAYQVCKALDFNGKNGGKLSDVVHWMHNMCGNGYMEEIASYMANAGGYVAHLAETSRAYHNNQYDAPVPVRSNNDSMIVVKSKSHAR